MPQRVESGKSLFYPDGYVLSRKIIETYTISIDYLTYFIIQDAIREKLEAFSQKLSMIQPN